MKLMKILKTNLLTVLFIVMTVLCTATVFATPCTVGAAPDIKKIDYEGKGRIDIDFAQAVQYKNVKVTVKDANGKKYKLKINGRDSDDINFSISGYKAGKKYKFTISGIRVKGETKYGSVKGSFKIPKQHHGITVKELEYEKAENKIEIEFLELVEWKSPKVKIKAGGKNYALGIKEKDANEITVKVKELTKGKTYSYSISGIRKKGNTKYVTITGKFVA